MAQIRPAGRADDEDADLGAPATIILVRHGSTDDTDQQHARGGDGAGPPLNEKGRRQAHLLARVIADQAGADHGYELPIGRPPWVEVLGRRPVAVITSPMRRASETAEVLAAPLGLEPVVEGGWAELALGVWDGLGYAEIVDGWPEEYNAWRSSPAVAPPGGESLDAVAQRAGAACDRLVGAYPGRTVLVISHTAPIRAVIARALDAGPAALWRLRIEPAAVSVLRVWSDGGCEVSTVNSTGHLA
jgi:ribonuclease H / adenosylcobalamin/alpha-ribazole phosphatase